MNAMEENKTGEGIENSRRQGPLRRASLRACNLNRDLRKVRRRGEGGFSWKRQED